MEEPTIDFIIIDDDRVSNLICSILIQAIFPEKTVKTFTDPEAGLAYMRLAPESEKMTTVLLDINMPLLTGWDVLDVFETFPDMLKKQYRIFMLSSSVDFNDKQRACNHILVTEYIEKPLTKEKLKELFA